MQSGIPTKKLINNQCLQYMVECAGVIIEYLDEASKRDVHIGRFFSSGNFGRIFYASKEKCTLVRAKRPGKLSNFGRAEITPDEFPDLIETNTAYVRHHEKLYYVDKTEKVENRKVVEVLADQKPLTQKTIEEIDSILRTLNKLKKAGKRKELNECELQRITMLTRHRQKSSCYRYFNSIFDNDLIVNAFEKIMENFEMVNAAQIVETVHGIADAFFDPVIKSEEWSLYWMNQCELMGDLARKNEFLEGHPYSPAVVYRKIVNGFCYRILGEWKQKQLVIGNKEFHVKEQIITKVLNMNNLDEFIATCKKKIVDDCSCSYDVFYKKIKNNSLLSYKPFNPRNNYFYNYIDNGDLIIKAYLDKRDLEERNLVNLILDDGCDKEKELDILNTILIEINNCIFSDEVMRDLSPSLLIGSKNSNESVSMNSSSVGATNSGNHGKWQKMSLKIPLYHFSSHSNSDNHSSERSLMELSPLSSHSDVKVSPVSMFKTDLIQTKSLFIPESKNDKPLNFSQSGCHHFAS